MSGSLAHGYYRMALSRAKRRDLTDAVLYARAALALDENMANAARLLALCSGELDEPDSAETAEVMEKIRALVSRKKWRKAAALTRTLPHQSVRALNAQGCMYASAGWYRKAASLFAQALAKDTGSAFAREALTEAAKKRSWR